MPDTLPGFRDFQHPAVTVADLGRALGFYRDLLGLRWLGHLMYKEKGLRIDFLDAGNNALVELFSFPDGRTLASDFDRDDRQRGLRHVAFRVRSVDTTAARLKRAGVTFTLEPLNAVGGVRIAFFLDPDGNLVEILEGTLQYHRNTGAARPVAPAAPWTGELTWDHVAVTVADRARSVAFYRDRLGFPLLGELVFGDERGFVISYLQAGHGVVELFSFERASTVAHPWEPDERQLGLKHLGFLVDDVFAGMAWLEQRGVPVIYRASHALGAVDTGFFADPDGNALELISGTVTYDA